LHAVATIERSGPLYYSLAWLWAKPFGTSEVALRALAALLGTATVIAVFALARELLSSRTALIAAALAAVCPDLVWYSQEARSYPLLILLATLGLYFFARTLRRPSRATLVGWALASSLALATHYFSFFLVAPEAAWLALRGPGARRRRWTAVAAVAAAGLALLPLAIGQEGSGRANVFTQIPVLERGASSLIKFMAGEGPSTAGRWAALPTLSRVLGLVALAACAAAIWVALARRDRAHRAVIVVGAIGAFAFVAPLALALAGLDYVEPRNLLGSLVPLLVVVSAGIEIVWRSSTWPRVLRIAGPAIPAAIGGAFAAMVLVTPLAPRLERDDWRGLSRLILADGPAAVILTQPPSAGKPLGYYFGHPLERLDRTDLPCGIRSRRLVTLSRNAPAALAGSGFRLVSMAETAQRWRVATYRARRPVRLGIKDLRMLDFTHGDEAPRVDVAARPSPRPYPSRDVSVTRTSPSRTTASSSRASVTEPSRIRAKTIAGWPRSSSARGLPRCSASTSLSSIR
jgi:hypothetical protein